MLRGLGGLFVLAGLVVAPSACGARSELSVEDRSRTSGGGAGAPSVPLELCEEVAYEACTPVNDGPTVIRGDRLSRPDVAWFPGLGFLVAHDDVDDSRVDAVTLEGDSIWTSEVGTGRSPRLAVHPTRRRAAVVTDQGYGWMGPDGTVTYRVESPQPSDRFNSQLAAVDDGFVVVTGPVSDPTNTATAVSLRLPLTAGDVVRDAFYPDPPTPRIDRSLDVGFLLDRIGFESNPDDGLGLATFRDDDGLVLDASAFRGTSTNFVDGFFTEGADALFIFGGTVGFAVSRLEPDGTVTDNAVFAGEALAGFTAERLGDASGLHDVVLAVTGLLPDQTSIARYVDAEGALRDPIAVGPGGSASRIARYDRGVVVVWLEGDDILLRAVDCCLD